MRNSRFQTALFCLVLISIIVSSCSKENDNLLPEEATNSLKITPIIQDNVMTFESVSEFDTYYEQMNELYDADDEKYDAIIEAQDLNTVFKKLLNDSFKNPADRFQPFLADPIMMGIANEHFEFQIENVLLTYVNNQYILTADINDTNARTQTRQLAKGNDFDFNTIPANTFLVEDNNSKTLLGPWGTVPYVAPTITASQKNGNCVIAGNTDWEWVQKWSDGEALTFRTASYKKKFRTYEETIVVSYSWNGSKWNLSNAALLSAHVYAQRRDKNEEDGCVRADREDEYKTCSCSNKRARVNKWGDAYHETTDVTGEVHKYYNGGTNLQGAHDIQY